MIDDVDDIAEMYDRDSAGEDQRLTRHQLERDITWRYLDDYLPSEGSILEIGAATGRYTLELAKRGYVVTAVDFSSRLLEKCRKRIADGGLTEKVRLVVADARNLGQVPPEGFDAALLMGPLYHLVEQEDRETAVSETRRRLKPGGMIFSTFITRLGILGDLLKGLPQWIEDQAEVRSVIEQGSNPKNPRIGDFRGYFGKVSEVSLLHESLGFETLVVAGVEPAISADDESYNRLEGKQRELWLDLLYEVSSEESILGASRHILYIGKKAAEQANANNRVDRRPL
jgi:S-adenosylmethionine-dependent methyltransferase